MKGEDYLLILINEICKRYWHLKVMNHFKIEWPGQPENFRPEADICIIEDKLKIIVEYDQDCDPGRSLTKYWPIIKHNRETEFIIIEVWKRGSTIGQGYAALARWMGNELIGLYPNFKYEFIERQEESPEVIAGKVLDSIERHTKH